MRTWDTETETHTLFKRKASPWHTQTWVVMHAYKDHTGESIHSRYWGGTPPEDGWFEEVLTGTKFLAGTNLKFDVLHAIVNKPKNYAAWMKWVVDGGRIWDCQLAEYLLNGMTQKDQMLSLDEMAPRYGGELKHDAVRALWAEGVPTHRIDPVLLSRYLVGEKDPDGEYRHGDIGNTEAVALGQIKRARQAGQMATILLDMDALLCSIEMEKNGMFVDKARGLVLAAGLAQRVRELTEELEKFLPELPFQFNWGSPKQRSALLFGGEVLYDTVEYLGTVGPADVWWGPTDVWWCPPRDGDKPVGWRQQYAQKEEKHYVLEDGTTCEPLWWEHCLHTEWQGTPPESKCIARYSSGKNAGEPKTKKVKVDDLTKPKSRKCRASFRLPRLTEPNPQWEGEEPGVYSTSSEVIEELGTRDLPFLKALALLQKLTKDLGTYYLTTDAKGVEKGMLTLVGPDGIIHHSINHVSTVTGRFSSSNPNLQNIPKGNTSDIKSVFVSRWGLEGCIIQSDFSSLEVYVQAILTQCDQLVKDLRAGVDMHVMRLSVSEGKPYDELLLLCKGDKKRDIAPVKEWDYKRTGAKVFSFQRAYGAGVSKIAASTGMTVEAVQALVDAENLRYPEIDEYYKVLTTDIKSNRRPTSTFVPHPVTKQMVQLGKSYYRTPDGKLYSYIESLSPEFLVKQGTLASFSPTEIRNYVVQGTGGQWMKAAMALMIRAFYRRGNFGGLALLVNTVHDAAYADAHLSVRDEAAALIHACMEAASDYMEYLFDWQLPVLVPSDTTWGPSMMEEKPLPDTVAAMAAVFREDLRVSYMQGYVPTILKEAQ